MKATTPQDRVLVRNAHAVLTGRSGVDARSSACDLRIADGVIQEMGRGLAQQPGERVLDATDCVVYPGWVNTHHHLFQSLLKGIPAGIDATLTPWLKAVPYAHRGGFDDERLRLAVRVGLVELLLSGCTTVADHHYIFYPGMAFDPAQILFEEAERLGLRAMLLRGGATQVRDAEVGGPAHLRPESLDQFIASVETIASRYHDNGPRPMTRVAMAPTTINISMRPEEVREAARAARRLGIPMHSHLSETVSTQEHVGAVHDCLPLEFAQRCEWVGPDVWFAHLVHVSERERDILASTGTGIAHCPQSNGRLGSGVAPAPDLARRGGRVSLGVDGAASNEAADMLSEVHFCWLVHRAHAGAASQPRVGGGGEAGADAVSVEQVVHWATKGGADILGFDGVGTLQPGAAADLAVYSLDEPRYMGLHDPALGPVVSGGRPHLRWLLSAGRVVAENDTIPGLDLQELRSQARAAVKQLAKA